MIDPQAEAIKRLIQLAKAGAQRTPLIPRVAQDLSDPAIGMVWIREDEKKAYLKISDTETLLLASAAPVSGEGAFAERSLPAVALMLNTITRDELASNSVGADELASDSVDGAALAPLINAISQVKINASSPTAPPLTLDVSSVHTSDLFRVWSDGEQRFRVGLDSTAVGADLPDAAFSVETERNTGYAMRVRSAGGALLAENAAGERLFSVDPSGNLVVAGSISSQSGNSDTAGSLAILGALTVTDQANFLAGMSVTERADFRAEMDIDGRATFNVEPYFPSDYSAKVGGAVHFRTLAAEENRLILEGISAIGEAEVQFGTGGPVLRGSLAQNDRMFIGDERIVTSSATGIRGNQLATDTITGGVGPDLGNIAAETITGYNIKNGSITSTEMSPGAVVRAAIDAGAVGSVELADGSVIDRVVASMGVGKLIAGTFNADEVFMGPSGHIYLGPTFASEILGERIQIDASGIAAYNSFNTPLAEFRPGGFTLRTGVDGARMSFDADTGLELFGTAGERTGLLSPLGQFELNSAIDGARMSLDSQDGVKFFAGATTNLAYNPGFLGGSEHELAVAGEASNDQRHVFAGEFAVRFRATNPNVAAPSYVDVPFKNTVGTGSSVIRTRVNYCPNPSVATVSTGWVAAALTAQIGAFGAALGFINDRAVWVVATAPGAASIQTPVASTPASVQWAISASVRVSTAQNVTPEIIWYDVNNAVIRIDPAKPVALRSNYVTQVGLVATAPSNATTFRFRVLASLQNTDRLEVSNVLYERASGIDAYFDGYTSGYQWDGTPGNSTSSLVPVAQLDSADNLLSIFVWSDVPAWAQIEGRDSTAGVGRGLSVATQLTANQWSRVSVQCAGKMDKVRLYYPSTDPARQTRITATPIWWSGLQVEADKDVPTPFCSGGEPGCRWQGLEGKSPSIRDRDVVVTQISPTLGTTVSGAIVGGSLTAASFFAGRIFGTEITGVNIKGSTLSGNLISGDQIIAGSLQGTSLAVRTVKADVIDVNAITAEKIAVNAVKAIHLESELVLTTKIVAGNPAGAHIEITSLGVIQYDAEGSPTVSFGKDPQSGNYLTIVDPTNTQRALASISDEGEISASGLNVSGNFVYKGDELSSLINTKPRGLVSYAYLGTDSQATTTTIGVGECEFLAEQGRAYVVSTNRVAVNPNKDAGFPLIFFTTDGSRPTVNSPIFDAWWDGAFQQLVYPPVRSTAVRFRLLLAIRSVGGSVALQGGGSGGIQMFVTDVGTPRLNTGVLSTGGGTGTPTTSRKTVSWNCTWHGTWNPNNLRGGLADMVQGYISASGDNRAAFGFDDANIRAQLAGATIHGAGIYLYSNHWYYSSGGYARIRSHNGTPNGVYPGVSGTRWVAKMGKPQGLWIDLGAGLGNEFRDGQTRGFALDATDVARNLVDYGRFDGSGQAGRPILAIDFTN